MLRRRRRRRAGAALESAVFTEHRRDPAGTAVISDRYSGWNTLLRLEYQPSDKRLPLGRGRKLIPEKSAPQSAAGWRSAAFPNSTLPELVDLAALLSALFPEPT